jgi:TolA-binding protein
LGQLPDPALRRRLVDHGEQILDGVQPDASLLALADSLAAGPQGQDLAPCLGSLYLAAGDPAGFARQALRAPGDGLSRAVWLKNAGLRCLDYGRGDASARRQAARELFEAMLAEPGLSRDLSAGARMQLASIRLDEDAEARLGGSAPSEREVGSLRQLLADIRRSLPGSGSATEALVAELHLLRDRLGRPQAADSLLRDWLLTPDRSQDPAMQWGLELELGSNLMALGRFDEAAAHYRSLLRRTQAPALTVWARFRLAQIAAVQDNARAAQDSLAALAKEDPGSALANDALDLALLLAEAQQWPGPVRELLAAALPQALGGRPAAAAQVLLAFAGQFPEDPSAPSLFYFAGNLLEQAYQGRAALDAWLRLADSHPDDFRAPQALEKAARLLHRLGEDERARALVERILDKYPDTPLLPGLRDLREALEAVS